jgi:hypothetical protein
MQFSDFNAILELSVAISLTSDIFKDQIDQFIKKFNNLKAITQNTYETKLDDLYKKANKDSEISNTKTFLDRLDENLEDFDKDSLSFKTYQSLMFGYVNLISLIISIFLLFIAAHFSNEVANCIFILLTYLVFFRPFIAFIFFKYYIYKKDKRILELEKTIIGK